jgi:hypothetical protein
VKIELKFFMKYDRLASSSQTITAVARTPFGLRRARLSAGPAAGDAAPERLNSAP